MVTDVVVRTTALHDHVRDEVNFYEAFTREPVAGRAILKSEALHAAFSELGGLPGAQSATVLLSPDPAPRMAVSAGGETGRCVCSFQARS